MNEFPLPGGIGVSHLRAYDWAAEDGVRGGSPHVHLACTEAYVVTGGRGAVQTLSAGGYAETPLEAGVIAWFAPGTVHRMVQDDGLRVTVLMQNSGLPEAGDAVFTFPPQPIGSTPYPMAPAGPAMHGWGPMPMGMYPPVAHYPQLTRTRLRSPKKIVWWVLALLVIGAGVGTAMALLFGK